MRWDDIEMFLAVARTGSLTAAGAELDVNPSTVLRRLQLLETTLGVRLFDRDPRGTTLTPTGEVVLPRAQRMAEEALAVHRAATGDIDAVEGSVRLTLPPELVDLVAPAIAALTAEHPALQVELLTDVRQYDLGREADVALRLTDEEPQGVVARRVGSCGWRVYHHADAPEPTGWIRHAQGTPASCAWRWQLAHDCNPGLARATTAAGVVALARALPARALLPCFLADVHPELVGEGGLATTTDLWVLATLDGRRSARVRATFDHLADALAALAPRLAGA
jgi:DNA-binding transcriptional LysR family regulator